jgi:divalent metal cation (Fe/Co/Zn/Cd) transporter
MSLEAAHEISAQVKYAILEAIPSVVKVLVHMEPYREIEAAPILSLPPA